MSRTPTGRGRSSMSNGLIGGTTSTNGNYYNQLMAQMAVYNPLGPEIFLGQGIYALFDAATDNNLVLLLEDDNETEAV